MQHIIIVINLTVRKQCTASVINIFCLVQRILGQHFDIVRLGGFLCKVRSKNRYFLVAVVLFTTSTVLQERTGGCNTSTAAPHGSSRG